MFDAAETGRRVSRKEYKASLPALRADLLAMQQRLRGAPYPVIIIVAGVEGVGRGEVVNQLNAWLDTRGVQTHAFWDVSSEEQSHPRYWRYWRSLPSRGVVGIFFDAWYAEPLRRRIQREWDDARFDAELARIRETERMLAADGAVVLKFWLHLPKAEQRARLKSRRKDPASRWYRLPHQKDLAKAYTRFTRAAEQLVRGTDASPAPWFVIEATDRHYRDLTIARTLLAAVNRRLDDGPASPPSAPASEAMALLPAADARVTVLDRVDLSQSLSRKAYDRRLDDGQARLRDLTWRARAQGVASVLVFEGWDAAGKGGAIRRLTEGVDARLLRVVPVAAPTDEERAHHYLWRFWRHVPPLGQLTVFDRSWYGRVLVERVEGLTDQAAWGRAYQEVNDFEQQLHEHGILVIKLWLHISRDEQLRRFRHREETPYKRHKITAEDWRNRGRWDDYERAVDEMVLRTSTDHAPWTLVPAEDKRFGRVAVIETVCERLEAALG